MSLILFGTIPISIQAGNDVKLSKEENAIVKKLKASFKPKSVDMKIGEDGFKFYELISKEGTHFIADSVGTIIIDPKYEYSYIIYIPKAEISKRDYFHSKWGHSQAILSVPVERTFIASKNSRSGYSNGDTKYPSFFYNEQGELLTFYTDELEKFGNTLFRVHHIGEDTSAYGLYGVISADGREIIPTEYDFVTPSSKFIDKGYWSISSSNGGIKFWGITNITDTKIGVPCKFYDVELLDDDRFLVRLTEHDTPEIYDSSKDYTLEFDDKGKNYIIKKNIKR